MKKSIAITIFCAFVLNILCIAQEVERLVTTDLGTDIVSRNVWRGTDFGASPTFLPFLSVGIGGFEIGAVGSYATRGTYSEVDLYAQYTSEGFSLMLLDYYFPEGAFFAENYFNYGNGTDHAFELALSFDSENFPVRFYAGTLFFGADKNENGDNIFSTYLETAIKIPERNIELFIGFTPNDQSNFYGTGLGVVNTGATFAKELKITEHFSLPIFASLIFNPQMEKVHFVFGMSL